MDKSDLEDAELLICAPPGFNKGVTGSIEITADCGHEVMVAPSGMAALQDPSRNTKSACIKCAFEKFDAKDVLTTKGPRIVPGAREEIIEEVGYERATEALKGVQDG